jgi:hypothetical protein
MAEPQVVVIGSQTAVPEQPAVLIGPQAAPEVAGLQTPVPEQAAVFAATPTAASHYCLDRPATAASRY